MTDEQILMTAREVGWNTEHRATNDYLVRFARALMNKRWVGLTEEDFSAINQSCLTKLQAATSAESVLKEKNT